MTNWGVPTQALLSGILCGFGTSVLGASVSDYAVRVSATVQTNPPLLVLSWPADPDATGYSINRKLRDDADWGSATDLAAGTTKYVDSNVAVGSAYEYQIFKSASGYYGVGYIYAGVEVPLVESRGKVVLIVDNTFSASLAMELTRFQQDLVGDGWTFLRHDVPRMEVDPANTSSSVWMARSNELASVRALIRADYNADPANVRAVFLFGHVPVPYSGDDALDQHPNHVGAWPADLLYGSMNGTWTDASVTDTVASDRRNWNVPGDGKFDQSSRPSFLELQVGRVDMVNLPAFSVSETELLRRYLNKNHAFRHKLFAAERRGLIDDEFGLLDGEVPAVNGWRNFAPFFGDSNTVSGDWQTTLSTQSYLWGYGCGAGTFTSCSGVASTTELATSDPRVVFTMFFGSYFGDWDSQNNFLRAALATTNYTLTSAWACRPYWLFHHMAMGETTGFSTRLTQNNLFLYDANYGLRGVHIALMGDPTLRMHVVGPPSGLVASREAAGVKLTWNPSTDTVLGYHIYRSTNAAGPFTRLNTSLITDTNYVDSEVGTNVYMVRAVKLEVSSSGSYYNASQGIFQSYQPLPVLTIRAQDTNKVYGAPMPEFTVSYAGFVGGDTPADLDAPPVLSTTATADSPVGSYPIHISGAGDANYVIQFVAGTLDILPAGTTGVVSSSSNPALPGQNVTLTMTLSAVAPGVGTPTGTVQFKIDGANAGAPVALNGGVASYVTSALSLGTHTVMAEYAGDGNFTGTTNSLAPDLLVNTPPVAAPDTIERDPTNSVKVAIAKLLSNDTDADGDLITFFGVSAASTHGGTVVSNSNWIFYTPAAGWTDTDTFTYTISDGRGDPVIGTVTVNVRLDNGPSPNLIITVQGNGSYLVRGDGIPDRTYRVQYAEDVENPDWQTLGPATADANGIFEIIDSAGSPQRFYRSVYP